jgi:hypothetical protein
MRPFITSVLLCASAGGALAQSAVNAGSAAAPDDRAGAADATADVASVPAAATTKPSSDDIDLGALGLDPVTATVTDDPLTVYGFADFTYDSAHWSKNVGVPDYKTFLQGNLNVYLRKKLMPKTRALAEIRFTFSPNGSQGVDGSVTDTTATDLTDYYRPVQWGGVVIERAYLEYELTDHLTLRGGHWLTPYGIWNTDHGSPVVIPIGKPFIVGEQFFPVHQTGLDLFGSHTAGDYQLSYHLTASNGRGGSEAQMDQDDKFAFGGRLELWTPWGLTAGGSYYRGRYTGLPKMIGAQPETYLEAGYAGDAQFDQGPLHVQAEVIARDRHYAADALAAAAPGVVPDSRDFGWYVLAGYRFDRLWNVMPFMFYEDERPGDQSLFSKAIDVNAGLNFRPAPPVVFKVMATYVWFSDGPGLFAGAAIREFQAQASWVF